MRCASSISLVAVLLASTVSASEPPPANASEVELIKQQILNVVAATTNLSNGIYCYSGQSDLGNLVNAASAVKTALDNGTALIKPLSDQVTFQQSLDYLLSPTVDLNMIASKATDGIIAQKNTFVAACLASTVLQQVTGLYNAAVTFRTQIGSKFNSYDEGIVELVSQPAIDALSRGVAAYSDQNGTSCTPSTASSTPSFAAYCKNGVYTGAAVRTTALPILAFAGMAVMAIL